MNMRCILHTGRPVILNCGGMNALLIFCAVVVFFIVEVQADCIPSIPLVLDDIHDGDQKMMKAVTSDTFTIQSYPNTTQWEVKGQWDINCAALIDFNVPGKENPPPNDVKISVWVMQSAYMSTMKLGFEFSDPMGQLAPKNEPINVWISAALPSLSESIFDHVKVPTRTQGSPCIYTPYHKDKVFDDMHDSDQKGVLVEKAEVTIKPHDNDQEWVVKSTFDENCVATVDFDVPGKPNPPPHPLTLSIWDMASVTGEVQVAMVFTEPQAGPPVGPPLNIWVPQSQ